MKFTPLTDQLLIAMPGLNDPSFQRTVVYVCAHNEDGAMGIVINRPLDFMLGEMLSQMELEAARDEINNKTVYQGGPVQTERGFVLHRQQNAQWNSSLNISRNIGVTTSRDILKAIAAGKGPEDSLIALGYAGWAAGQLEEEMSNNAWLSVPCDDKLLFSAPPRKRWHLAVQLLGIDATRLSFEAGHA